MIAGPGRTGARSAGGTTAAGGSWLTGLAAATALSGSSDGTVSAACVAPTRPLAARLPAAAFGAAPSGFASPANASLSLRTTGASIVEDADRTNSPISWSLAMTALLSTPNSFASSYTRTFATTLPLLGPEIPDLPAGRGSACSVRRQLVLFIAACSSGAHCNLSLLPPGASGCRHRNSRIPGIRRPCRSAAWPAGEGPARMPCGAGLVPSMPGADAGMHPAQAAARQRRELSRPLPLPHGSTRSWPHAPRSLRRFGSVQPTQAYRAGCSSGAAWSSGCGRLSAVSALMSMRHPVSRAASRAFCPSLPIARDNW